MEEVCQRFPLIAQKILNNFDNETLINFKEAGRNNNDFLRKERSYWIRIIQSRNCNCNCFQEVWKKVIKKTPVETIKELAAAVLNIHPTLSGNMESKPPLFFAAMYSSLNLCNHIIEKAGTVGIKATLIIASFMGIVKMNYPLNIFKLLLEKADDKNPILTFPIGTPRFQHIGNRTLLHDLAERGNLEMCKLIVEKVEDKNPKDVFGITPYHIAARFGDVKLCQILMEHLIDKNPTNIYGHTPFSLAASHGHLEACRLFMETCVDKNHVDDGLRIPLHNAVWNGHVEVVGLFMANLVDKNLRDTFGQKTPLLTAILGGHLDVCKLLIEEYKVDVNLSDNYGITPLHLASQMGQLETCILLCKHVLDKNTLDNFGATPLDTAVMYHKWNVVSFLNKWSPFRLPQ